MITIKKYIPNSFTFLNLISGLVALISLFNGYFDHAFYFVCLGIFFDFFDGFFARKFNVEGALGVQLDSLADMVTSGVVPGMLMYVLLRDIIDNNPIYMVDEHTFYYDFVPYFGFIIILASAYRLAMFNISENKTTNFIGLPTPANALFIMSLPLISYSSTSQWLIDLIKNPYFLIIICCCSAYLLNAKIILFSLKIKRFSLQAYPIQLGFLAIAILLIAIFSVLAIPLLIILYILLSLLINFGKKKTNKKSE